MIFSWLESSCRENIFFMKEIQVDYSLENLILIARKELHATAPIHDRRNDLYLLSSWVSFKSCRNQRL